MFLNKIRKIFCVLCPQQMLRAQANGETFLSVAMCPHLPGPLSYVVDVLINHNKSKVCIQDVLFYMFVSQADIEPFYPCITQTVYCSYLFPIHPVLAVS